MDGVPGTVGRATDLVQRRVDMGQKSTNGRGTVTIHHQRTEEEDAMDPRQNTSTRNALSEDVILVCTFSSSSSSLSLSLSLSFSLSLSLSLCFALFLSQNLKFQIKHCICLL